MQILFFYLYFISDLFYYKTANNPKKIYTHFEKKKTNMCFCYFFLTVSNPITLAYFRLHIQIGEEGSKLDFECNGFCN